MNTSKSKTFVILILFLAFTATGVVAWRQRDELVGLRSSKVSEKDMAAARARAFDAEKRIKELEAELALAKANQPAAAEAPANGRRGGANAPVANANAQNNQQQPNQGGRGGNAGQQQLQNILNNPEALALQATAAKANISVQYAGFFRNAGLNGEQADAVTTLMANRQSVQQDVMAAAAASGIQPDPQTLRTLVAEQQAQIDSQIKSTMGDAAYTQYSNYQSTMARRQEVASFQQQLTMAGVPLDAAQAEALVSALGPSTNGRGGDAAAIGGGGFGGVRGGGGTTNISANNIAAASSILNASQMQVLQAAQQAQQAQSSLGQITATARAGQQQQQQRGGQAATVVQRGGQQQQGVRAGGAAAAPQTNTRARGN